MAFKSVWGFNPEELLRAHSIQQPTPERFFNAINAYEQTEAMKAAVELEIFTAIDEGKYYRRNDCEALRGRGTRRAHTVRFLDHSRLLDQRRSAVRSRTGFSFIPQPAFAGIYRHRH